MGQVFEFGLSQHDRILHLEQIQNKNKFGTDLKITSTTILLSDTLQTRRFQCVFCCALLTFSQFGMSLVPLFSVLSFVLHFS